MQETMREDAAGRLGNTLPKAWHDRIWNTYRSVVVFGNVPGKPAWYPPSDDGSVQGVIVARSGLDVLKFVATVDPLYPAQDGGAPGQP
ncbi:MAG: hypothetical protein P4L36_13165 [Holophaga sp.]|nr:hypothetical protein [Holophaga sp.]